MAKIGEVEFCRIETRCLHIGIGKLGIVDVGVAKIGIYQTGICKYSIDLTARKIGIFGVCVAKICLNL